MSVVAADVVVVDAFADDDLSAVAALLGADALQSSSAQVLRDALQRAQVSLMAELLGAFEATARDALLLNEQIDRVDDALRRNWPSSAAAGVAVDVVDEQDVSLLQVTAERLTFRIENRRRLRAELARRFELLLVPVELFQRVMAPSDASLPLDDETCGDMDRVLARRGEARQLFTVAAAELDAVCVALLERCVQRIRATVLRHYAALARGDGSFDVALLRFRDECSCQLRFLRRHAPLSAPAAAAFVELQALYFETAATLYHYHFFTYRTDLAKLLALANVASARDTIVRRSANAAPFSLSTAVLEIAQPATAAVAAVAGGADYLRSWWWSSAAPASSSSSSATATSAASTSTTISDGGPTRRDILDCSSHLQCVAYHEARTRGATVRFEYAWWSFSELLFAAVAREFNLQLELFGVLDVSRDVFRELWQFVEQWLCEQMIDRSFDCVELLLVYACNARNFGELRRQVPLAADLPCQAFFERAQARVINRYTELMARHATSLAEFVPPPLPPPTNASGVAASVATHYVTERYCELVGAVFCIVCRCAQLAKQQHQDETPSTSFVTQPDTFVSHAILTAPCAQLRVQFMRALLRLADQQIDVLRSTVLMVNNLSYVVSALQAPRFAGVSLALQEAGAVEQQLIEQVQVLVELLFAQCLPSLARLTPRTAQIGAEARAFRSEWRGTGASLTAAQALVVALVADFALAQLLLKRLGERIVEQHAALRERVAAERVAEALPSVVDVHNGIAKHLLLP